MKEGIIGAVFDYALGEISDELFDGLRAGTPGAPDRGREARFAPGHLSGGC